MKIFHLSDLHIGLKLINRDLREDQEFILNKIVDYAKEEKPDAIVIAGDIYDKAMPSSEAIEMFDTFINNLNNATLNSKIMFISGNHDSAIRINTFRNILSRNNIHMIGQAPSKENEYIEKVVMEDEFGLVNFYLLPFVKPSMVKNIVGTMENGNNYSYNDSFRKLIERENINNAERNILVSHQLFLPSNMNVDELERMDSEIVTVGNIDNIDASILTKFDYAALGHIHKPMKVGSEFYRYCGTPLASSFSESGQEKGIIIVELGNKNDISTRVLKLKPLREVRTIKGELEEILKISSNDFVSITLTDKKDLDVINLQERIRIQYPNVLEIKRDNIRELGFMNNKKIEMIKSPFELCMEFLRDSSEEEQDILKRVIDSVMEG